MSNHVKIKLQNKSNIIFFLCFEKCMVFDKMFYSMSISTYSIGKQMLWKPIIYTFCLLESWSHDQSVSTNVSH